MKKDEILQYLFECAGKVDNLIQDISDDFTTAGIEKRFDMKTNIANYHLNQLHKEGELIKINTKPVYYIPFELVEKTFGFKPLRQVYRSLKEIQEEKPTGILEQIIGSSGSLEECIRQCKVAVNYPGNGLPLLLNGPTGTGKTFLAKCLYRYAVQEKILCEDAPFLIFNCAEYANNPELLGSKLFGHSKGAFTGADKDVAGMIESANNGMLLIDEVHRLSPENQEKLFMFMDDGVFRRIGENGGTRRANVRLMFATTEELNQTFLNTFLRRIPIVVKLPPVSRRGNTEKKAFVYHFFQQQSQIMKKEIHAELPVINYLTSINLEGNVGGLENIIKYTCANAYIESKSSESILIKLSHIPFVPDKTIPVDFSDDKLEIVKINGNRIENNPVLNHRIERYIAFAESINDNFRKLNEKETRLSEYRKSVIRLINDFLDKGHTDRESTEKELFIYDSVKNALSLMSNQYDIKFDQESIRIIAEYIAEIPINLPKDFLKEKIDKEAVKELFSFNYEWCRSFIKVMQHVNQRYPVSYQDIDRLIIMSVFDYYSNQRTSTKVKAVIVSHGYSTASSLASTINRFIGENVFRAFDTSFEDSFRETGKKLRDYFRHIDTKDGVVILIDLGDPESIVKEVGRAVEGDIGVVDNVSVKLGVEVGSRIINDEPLNKIVREAVQISVTNAKVVKTQRKKGKAIIVTCQTGIGTAFKIKQLIEQCFSNDVMIDVIVSEYSRLVRDKGDMSIFSRYDVIGVIGTADPKVSKVPFVGLEDLMDEEGADKLHALFSGHISKDEIQDLNSKLIKSLSKENIINLLTILNPDKTLQYIEDMVHQWEKDFNIVLPNNLVISLYVHLSSMIERVITHNEMTFHENQKKYEAEHSYFFGAMNRAFEDIERNYHTTVPGSEIAYIYDIFKLKIPDFQF